MKKLGQRGLLKFQEYKFVKRKEWIRESHLKSLMIDNDSTVQIDYGNQQGEAKGYNPVKKGAKCYHPLLAFISELKLMVNNR